MYINLQFSSAKTQLNYIVFIDVYTASKIEAIFYVWKVVRNQKYIIQSNQLLLLILVNFYYKYLGGEVIPAGGKNIHVYRTYIMW